MKRISIFFLFAFFCISQAQAGFWDDLKEKSKEAEKKLLTEENKEKAKEAVKEYVEENQDEIKEKAEELVNKLR